MVNKNLVRTTILMVITGLFASIAFMFFNAQNLKKLFIFTLKKPIGAICPKCNIKVSDFDITSYKPSKFQLISNLEINTQSNNTSVLHTPKIKLELNFSKIFSKLTIPIKIEIDSAKLNLDTLKSKDINDKTFAKLINIFSRKKLLAIEYIKIKNSKLLIDKVHYSLDLNKTSITPLSYSNSLTITSKNFQSKIDAIANHENNNITTTTKIYNFPAKLITKIIPNKFQNDFLSQINKDLFISGTVKTTHNSSNKVLNAKFYNQTQNNDNSSIKFLLSLSSKNWHDRIDIKDFNLSLPQKSQLLYAKGYIQNYSKLLMHKTALSLSFKTKQLNLNSINSLYPSKISSETKDWINNSIKNGELTNLKGRIYIKDIFSNSPNNISIYSHSEFHNLSLNYMPEFPQIDELNGTITLNNSAILFNIDEGKMINSLIKKGSSVKINLKDPEVPLTINAKSDGPIKNFINFIDRESLVHLKNKKLDLQNIQGSTNASINIKIPLSKEICLENLILNIDASLNNVKLSAFDKFMLQGSLTLNIKDYLLSITGTPVINNSKSKFSWQTHLKDKMEFDHKLDLNTVFDASQKDLYLFHDIIHASNGKIFLTTQYIQKNQNEKFTVNANLDNPNIHFSNIDLVKKENKKSSFNLIATNIKEQGWKTKHCDFISEEENIKASSYFELSNNLEEIKKFDSIIESPNNNIKLNLIFNKKEGRFFITADHITPNKNHLLQFLNSQSFSKDRKTSVQLKVNKATMKNNIVFTDIAGNFACYRNICKNSSLSMKINDKNKPNSTLKIYKNNNLVVLHTNNAAALLKGFDTYNNIEGGIMTISLRTPTKNSLQKNQLKGNIYIRNFRAFKTSILAKLILMTPFTQIVEQLKGQNLIHFKDFKGSFVIENNVIKLRQSRATGDLITITLNGSIDLNKQAINLEGELIPKCFFNEFISKIQNEKQNNSEKYQLATHYKISGNLNKPKIHVTPISILVSLFTKPLSII
ncbi:MAG: hypothetical protein HRU36_02200 [Rickettsiales bacterium]|nr:hypothetical protein [Rickettsiales bacterium]